MKKIKLFTLTLFFIISTVPIANAGCGGPQMYASLGGYCPRAPMYTYPLTSTDTVTTPVAATDSIHIVLSANPDCDQFDSVQWFKDGILLSTVPHTSLMDYTFDGMGPGTYTCKFKLTYRITFTIVYLPATTTSIASLTAETNAINVYPNPSNGIFTVDAGTDALSYTITVSDVSGRIIKEIRGNEKILTVDISTYAPGFYSLAYIDNNGRRKTKKLICN